MTRFLILTLVSLLACGGESENEPSQDVDNVTPRPANPIDVSEPKGKDEIEDEIKDTLKRKCEETLDAIGKLPNRGKDSSEKEWFIKNCSDVEVDLF